MKTPSHAFTQMLRRIVRLVVRQSEYQHNPLLISGLAAFNFRPPLMFPNRQFPRSGAFSR